MLWNVEGLKSLLSVGASDYFQGFDLLILNETFQLQSLSLKGFYCFEALAKKQNAGRPIGGITVAVKPDGVPRLLFSTVNCVAVETDAFIILNFYFSPALDCLAVLEEVAEKLCSLDLSKACYVTGDFNARIDVQDVEKSSLLIDLLEDFGFFLLNDRMEFTYYCHNGRSTIDLVFANQEGAFVTVEDENSIILNKKHVPVVLRGKLPCKLVEGKNTTKGKRRTIDQINPEILQKAEEMVNSGEIENAYSELCEGIIAAIPENKEPRKKPRYSQEIERQKHKVFRLHRKAKYCQTALTEYANEKRKFKVMISEFEKAKYDTDEFQRIKEAETMPWKFNRRRNGMVPCKIPLTEWVSHFSMLYNPPPAPTLSVEVLEFHNYQVQDSFEIKEELLFETDETDELNKAFTVEECKRTLMTCNDKKAVGPDCIANEHLKGSFNTVGYLWVLLFNSILMTGEIFKSWRNSTVKVLYKGKGDNRDANSYRGIAMLNHIYKWFTKMLASRLSKFTENRSMPPEQFGFRQGRSTLDAFFKLRSYVLERIESRTPVYAVFVDFRKAFDMVPRKILLRKLTSLHSIRGRILRVLVSLLQFNLIKVFDDVAYSGEIPQNRGVQQGDSLSPLLFILFVSDLPRLLKDVTTILSVILFADDLVIYSTCKKSIQNALNELSRYCKQNMLEVNLSKTKLLTFKKGGFSGNEVFYFNGHIVEKCSSYEYLGITVQPTWIFSKHLLKKRAKAAAASFSIGGLQKLSLNAAKKYFSVMIEPIVTYGIEVIWYDLNEKQLETLDGCLFDYFKKVLGVPRSKSVVTD